jgi:CYTH domain-containing protein/predicted ATPase
MHPVHRIVLTGGPCGGKSTTLARISDRLSALGFRVFLAPEQATLLFSGGASLAEATVDQVFTFQSSLLKLQMATEEAFLSLARACGAPAVVIFDRGTMDPSAYLPPASWQALLDELGESAVSLRDRRYDAVIHLVTAADGAEDFYTTLNNTTRKETPAQARDLDQKLQQAWTGHPHLRIIDNSTSFEGKLRRVFEAVCQVTGIPEPIEIERKFLIRSMPDTLPVPSQTFDIEQTYLLTTDGSEARVRRRGQNGAYTYTHTVKRALRAGQRVEVERPISPREYIALLSQADPSRRLVSKRRTCLLWQGQYLEIDRFLSPCKGLIVLEIELDHPDREVSLPPFLTVEREVTADTAYNNFSLAGRDATP